MFKAFVFLLLSASFAAYAGAAVKYRLTGTEKVCYYEDGSSQRVARTEECPLAPGHNTDGKDREAANDTAKDAAKDKAEETTK